MYWLPRIAMEPSKTAAEPVLAEAPNVRAGLATVFGFALLFILHALAFRFFAS
jgi:hypothetical protein